MSMIDQEIANFYPADFTFACPANRRPGAETLKPSLDLAGVQSWPSR